MFRIQLILCKWIKVGLPTWAVPSGVASLDQILLAESVWSDEKASRHTAARRRRNVKVFRNRIANSVTITGMSHTGIGRILGAGRSSVRRGVRHRGKPSSDHERAAQDGETGFAPKKFKE